MQSPIGAADPGIRQIIAKVQTSINKKCSIIVAQETSVVRMHWRNMLHHISNRYTGLDWPDREYAYTVKNRRRFSYVYGCLI